MADPKEARRLLDELPADALKALDELAHWHESASAAEGFRADARLQLLFQLEDAAQPRLRKIEREYFAVVAAAARARESRIWTQAHDYCRQSGQAYGRVIDEAVRGAKGADALRPQLPLLAVRALRALAQQLKWLYLRYGPIDPALWGVLNGFYSFAEARGIADAPVAAVYAGASGESSARREFSRAVLLYISSPDGLVPAELDMAERLIAGLAGEFALGAQPRPEHTHWIDLARAMVPQRVAKSPQPAATLRFAGAGAAGAHLHKLGQQLASTGQVPPGLAQASGQGPDPEAVAALIHRLVSYWSAEPPARRHPRHAVKSKLSIVHGFEAVAGTLGGEASLDFNAQPTESWSVENVSAGGFSAIVPQARGEWLKIGALLALQPEGGDNWVVGVIRRVSKTSASEARVGIQTLSRAPELVQFRLRGEDLAGLLLPAPGPAGEAAIALRSGLFAPGQNLECERGGASYLYMPQGAVEHGEDYDLAQFREMVREA